MIPSITTAAFCDELAFIKLSSPVPHEREKTAIISHIVDALLDRALKTELGRAVSGAVETKAKDLVRRVAPSVVESLEKKAPAVIGEISEQEAPRAVGEIMKGGVPRGVFK